jgi:bla regulator protein blaR1
MTGRWWLVLGGRVLLCVAGALLNSTPPVFGQANTPQRSPEPASAVTVPEWQTAAGGKMAFEVASVRENPSGKYKPPPYSIDPDDDFVDTGGFFTADLSVQGYIDFAYKLPQQYNLLSHLPDWARNKQFEVQARAPAGTTKDQMRLMMQALLAERFKLAIHFEMHETPVLVMTQVRPGKLGQRLRLHKDGPACDVVVPRPPGATTTFDMFPCNVFMMATDRSDLYLAGARNTTVELMAAFFSNVGYKQPIVDRTGITEKIDFSMEYTPEKRGAAPVSADGQAEVPGTTFEEAVKDQLGLRLEPGRAPLQIPVVDHVEMPSDN